MKNREPVTRRSVRAFTTGEPDFDGGRGIGAVVHARRTLRCRAQCDLESQTRRENSKRRNEDSLETVHAASAAQLAELLDPANFLQAITLLSSARPVAFLRMVFSRSSFPSDDFVTQTHIFARKTPRTATNTFIFRDLFWHSRCSQTLPMTNDGVSLKQMQTRTFYANALRCIGQSLEAMQLKAVEVKSHGDNYVIQAWNKGTSTSMDLEETLQPGGFEKIGDRRKRETEGTFPGPPNLLSLSQVLRLAGNYVDRMRGRFIRVSWQDQSDKIQSVTIQYEPCPVDRREQGEAQTTVIEEVCVHIYKQRKKSPPCRTKILTGRL